MVLLLAWGLVADSNAVVEGIEDTGAVGADSSGIAVLGFVVVIVVVVLIERNKVEELDLPVDGNPSHC